MKNNALFDKNSEQAWLGFAQKETLSAHQQEQFKHFAYQLLAWNERMNLTAITDLNLLIRDHFEDSLAVRKFVPLNESEGICDVGSGGGFPGIPLKITNPQNFMVLLEVNQKKVSFLNTMIAELQLTNIEVVSLDFRTFVRKGSYDISYFLARASLRPDELIRVFSGDSSYKKSTVIYWASSSWQIGEKEKKYLKKEETYTLDHKQRKLYFFAAQSD